MKSKLISRKFFDLVARSTTSYAAVSSGILPPETGSSHFPTTITCRCTRTFVCSKHAILERSYRQGGVRPAMCKGYKEPSYPTKSQSAESINLKHPRNPPISTVEPTMLQAKYRRLEIESPREHRPDQIMHIGHVPRPFCRVKCGQFAHDQSSSLVIGGDIPLSWSDLNTPLIILSICSQVVAGMRLDGSRSASRYGSSLR